MDYIVRIDEENVAWWDEYVFSRVPGKKVLFKGKEEECRNYLKRNNLYEVKPLNKEECQHQDI